MELLNTQQVLSDWAVTMTLRAAKLPRGAHLGHQGPLCGQAMLQEEGALGITQAIQHHLQYRTQDTLPGLGQYHRLRGQKPSG